MAGQAPPRLWGECVCVGGGKGVMFTDLFRNYCSSLLPPLLSTQPHTCTHSPTLPFGNAISSFHLLTFLIIYAINLGSSQLRFSHLSSGACWLLSSLTNDLRKPSIHPAINCGANDQKMQPHLQNVETDKPNICIFKELKNRVSFNSAFICKEDNRESSN